jgi:hypothetical protein
MAEGRSRMLWDHTSALIWITAEINRDRKKRPTPYSPADFHRHLLGSKRDRAHVSVEQLTDEIMMVAESKLGRA